MNDNDNGDARMLERIRKLLNLAEGTRHQEEAESAMLKAQLILAENGWEMDDVPGFQDTRKVLYDCIDTDGKTPQNWQSIIAGVVAKNFRITLYFSTSYYARNGRRVRELKMVGMKHDVETCKEVTSFAFRWFEKNFKTFLNNWKRENKQVWLYSSGGENTSRTRRMKNDYLMGFKSGLDEKFKQQVEERALVLIQNAVVKQAVNELGLRSGGSMSMSRGYNDEAYNRGRHDGKRMKMGKEGGMISD